MSMRDVWQRMAQERGEVAALDHMEATRAQLRKWAAEAEALGDERGAAIKRAASNAVSRDIADYVDGNGLFA